MHCNAKNIHFSMPLRGNDKCPAKDKYARCLWQNLGSKTWDYSVLERQIFAAFVQDGSEMILPDMTTGLLRTSHTNTPTLRLR